MPSCCVGQARKAGAAGHRCAVREEAQGCRGCAKDVRLVSSLTHLPHLCNHISPHSAQSTLTNKSRLKLLQQREEHLQDLFQTAREAIDALAKDEARYVQFLEGVIVQGVLSLLEPEVTVHAREKDVDVVQRAAEGAAKQYAEISGRTVKVSVQGSLSNDM